MNRYFQDLLQVDAQMKVFHTDCRACLVEAEFLAGQEFENLVSNIA